MPHTKRVHFSLQNNATISVVKMFKVIILINGSQLCCKAFSPFQSTPPKIWSISIDYDLRDHYLIRVFLLLSSSSLLNTHIRESASSNGHLPLGLLNRLQISIDDDQKVSLLPFVIEKLQTTKLTKCAKIRVRQS